MPTYVQLENCAAWNDKQAARAERLGDKARAKRLELQAFRLWKEAHEIKMFLLFQPMALAA